MRRRVGWIVFAVAVTGLAVYMTSVGLNQASAIAGVGGFFVAVIGLALALAGRSTESLTPGQSHQQMSDVVAGKNVAQVSRVASDDVSQGMARVTARTGSVYQFVRGIQARAQSVKRNGDHDA